MKPITEKLEFIYHNNKILISEMEETISTLNVKLLDFKKQNSNIVQVISNIHEQATAHAENYQKISA